MSALTHQKSLLALAAVVASYLLASRVAEIEAPLSPAQAFVGLGALVVLPFVGMVLAVLDLREIRASRKAASAGRRGGAQRGYGLPVLALVLALAFAAAFHVRVIARLVGRARAVAALDGPSSLGGRGALGGGAHTRLPLARERR